MVNSRKAALWLTVVILFLFIPCVAMGAADQTAPAVDLIAPWTPLEFQAGALKMWGRDYKFGNSVFPQGITANGEALLAGPISLVCREAGGQSPLAAQRVVPRLIRPAQVSLSSEVSCGANLRATVTVRVEYDGLMLYHIELNPHGRATLQELSLEIPFRDGVASFYHKYVMMNQDWGQQATYAIPQEQGTLWVSPFNPYIWIGDPNKGLLWFSESDNDWHNGSMPLRIVRDGHVVKFNVSFVSLPTELKSATAYEFGLQATPTRPLPDHWRSIRTVYTVPTAKELSPELSESNPKPDIAILWPLHKAEWPWGGFPRPADKDRTIALIQSLHQKGIKVLLYIQAEAMDENDLPEFQKNKKNWQYIPEILGGTTLRAFNPSTSWSQYFLDALQSFLATYDVDGLYLDNIYIYPDKNPAHVSEGTVYPIIALRDLVRKVYVLAKNKNSQNLVIIHMSSHNLMPVLSFSDVILDGEHVSARPWHCEKDEKYFFGDAISPLNLEEFQGEFYGRQWGPAPMYLSTLGYKGGCLETRGPSEYVLAYALVHGVLLWGRFADDMMSQVFKVYDEYAVNEATFIPYWQSGAYLETNAQSASSSPIKASVYLNEKEAPGRALLVVSNLGPTPESVSIKLHLGALGISKPPQVRVLTVGSTTEESDLAAEDGQIKLTLPSYSFRLVGIN
jgi:hypothetical protein